ncbi:MAG: hypothetical protein M1820_008350 [Bogoriella megaspora]|nr:MAG: hypothetical protein M1820_008350 [Bogoriella megaspora]
MSSPGILDSAGGTSPSDRRRWKSLATGPSQSMGIFVGTTLGDNLTSIVTTNTVAKASAHNNIPTIESAVTMMTRFRVKATEIFKNAIDELGNEDMIEGRKLAIVSRR